MDLRLPTGILKNTKLNRFHPISFDVSPLPGGATLETGGRWKSIGHHTEGFETIGAAQKWIADNHSRVFLIDAAYEWDGEDIPAKVEFFTDAYLVEQMAKAQAR